ncbi:Ltp family lipoprotein [Staphylococcus sp. 11261D007BR]
MSEKKKWYQSAWFTILTLVFFFPIGLYLMWKHMGWKKWVKITITVIIAIIAINSFANTNNEEVVQNSNNEQSIDQKRESNENDTNNVGVDESENTKTEYSQSNNQSDKPTREQKSALKKAETYSNVMHMSKSGIYDQLTSEYGEQFPEDAAQYAIDNLDADYKKNALEKAKTYADDMNMSDNAIYDQLISSYGEQFTEEEAQYAVDNL